MRKKRKRKLKGVALKKPITNIENKVEKPLVLSLNTIRLAYTRQAFTFALNLFHCLLIVCPLTISHLYASPYSSVTFLKNLLDERLYVPFSFIYSAIAFHASNNILRIIARFEHEGPHSTIKPSRKLNFQNRLLFIIVLLVAMLPLVFPRLPFFIYDNFVLYFLISIFIVVLGMARAFLSWLTFTKRYAREFLLAHLSSFGRRTQKFESCLTPQRLSFYYYNCIAKASIFTDNKKKIEFENRLEHFVQNPPSKSELRRFTNEYYSIIEGTPSEHDYYFDDNSSIRIFRFNLKISKIDRFFEQLYDELLLLNPKYFSVAGLIVFAFWPLLALIHLGRLRRIKKERKWFSRRRMKYYRERGINPYWINLLEMNNQLLKHHRIFVFLYFASKTFINASGISVMLGGKPYNQTLVLIAILFHLFGLFPYAVITLIMMRIKYSDSLLLRELANAIDSTQIDNLLERGKMTKRSLKKVRSKFRSFKFKYFMQHPFDYSTLSPQFKAIGRYLKTLKSEATFSTRRFFDELREYLVAFYNSFVTYNYGEIVYASDVSKENLQEITHSRNESRRYLKKTLIEFSAKALAIVFIFTLITTFLPSDKGIQFYVDKLAAWLQILEFIFK